MNTQYTLLSKILRRKAGVTAMEIMGIVGTVCPHKRMADLKAKGWHITKRKVPGKTYHKYFGVAPADWAL